MGKLKIAVLGLVSLAFNTVFAYDDADFQIWNTVAEEININKDSKIVLEEEFRWADNANEFFYHHYDAGFSYGQGKSLKIGAGYRRIYELKRGKFKAEEEPYATATLSGEFKGFKLEDRSRMEYRHFDYQGDSGRYRNKVTVRSPLKFTGLGFQPWLSEEIFFSFGGTNQFNQNRFSSGLGMDLTEGLKAEIYYMLQRARSPGKWVDANILAFKLKAFF